MVTVPRPLSEIHISVFCHALRLSCRQFNFMRNACFAFSPVTINYISLCILYLHNDHITVFRSFTQSDYNFIALRAHLGIINCDPTGVITSVSLLRRRQDRCRIDAKVGKLAVRDRTKIAEKDAFDFGCEARAGRHRCSIYGYRQGRSTTDPLCNIVYCNQAFPSDKQLQPIAIC